MATQGVLEDEFVVATVVVPRSKHTIVAATNSIGMDLCQRHEPRRCWCYGVGVRVRVGYLPKAGDDCSCVLCVTTEP